MPTHVLPANPNNNPTEGGKNTELNIMQIDSTFVSACPQKKHGPRSPITVTPSHGALLLLLLLPPPPPLLPLLPLPAPPTPPPPPPPPPLVSELRRLLRLRIGGEGEHAGNPLGAGHTTINKRGATRRGSWRW
jgi:hypothetical protein